MRERKSGDGGGGDVCSFFTRHRRITRAHVTFYYVTRGIARKTPQERGEIFTISKRLHFSPARRHEVL